MATILLVEDDQDIAELVRHYLESEGLRAIHVLEGSAALARIEASPPDLLVLDIMLPGLSGLEVLRRLRRDEKTAGLPVLLLTAKGEEVDRIVGLELGADDYLPKPFSPRELVARVKALLRRTHPAQAAVHIAYLNVRLDPSRHEVSEGTRAVALTSKEFSLLEHFMRNPGRVFTREVLLDRVWGYDFPGNTRTVDVHVNRLRKKIPSLAPRLTAVRSLGYKLAEEELPGAISRQ
ncbi:MAG: response regulator [Nitrospirae bacterium]|nr:response regulator [Nitrospirota bacterium]